MFDGITALDLFGPLDVFSRVKALEIQLVACEYRSVNFGNNILIEPHNVLTLSSEYDVFVIPGGLGQVAFCDNQQYLALVAAVATKAKYVLTVCTGSLILAMCGLLKNKKAVTHWSAMDILEKLGTISSNDRIVEAGNIISCSGVSAGIDMALFFIEKIYGELEAKKIQLAIEYDPCPPFDFKALKDDEQLTSVFYEERHESIKKRHVQVANFLREV